MLTLINNICILCWFKYKLSARLRDGCINTVIFILMPDRKGQRVHTSHRASADNITAIVNDNADMKFPDR